LGEGFGLGAGLGGVVLLGGVTFEAGDLDVDVFFAFFPGVTTTLGLQKERKSTIKEADIFGGEPYSKARVTILKHSCCFCCSNPVGK